MTASTVAIVHLGRSGATGERARVASIRQIFDVAGAEVVDVPLRTDVPVRARDMFHLDVPALVRGRVVPESYSWSRRDLIARLESIAPDVVVANTSRSYHPDLHRSGTVVLDYVDCLSASYRQRSDSTRLMRRLGYRALAHSQERFESQDFEPGVHLIAAGRSDARTLGATWIPQVIEPFLLDGSDPDVDCVFFGNLAYPPNTVAVQRLAAFWPAVERARPGASLLVAGRNLSAEQRQVAQRLGWHTWADFPDLPSLLSRARIAVVPLLQASGIQDKVLEAGAAGMAQVVSPAAAAGFDPEFPFRVAVTDDDFVQSICELLDDSRMRQLLGENAAAHVRDHYRPECYVDWATGLLGA